MPRARPLVLAALALAGCGGGVNDEEAVRAALTSFERAVGERDVQALCDRVLARELVRRVTQAGLPCEVAVRPAVQGAERPSLRVRSVRIDGDRAEAVVETTAANQEPSTDRIRLVREAAGWRIASLG
jgi:hypothetical protein